jgi:hypothetical protein
MVGLPSRPISEPGSLAKVEPGICVFCGKQPEELETRRQRQPCSVLELRASWRNDPNWPAQIWKFIDVFYQSSMDDGSSTQPGTSIMDRQHSSGCPGALGVRFVRPPSSEMKPVHAKNAPKVSTFDEQLGALLHKLDTCGLFVVSFGCLNKILRGPGNQLQQVLPFLRCLAGIRSGWGGQWGAVQKLQKWEEYGKRW